MIINDWIEEVRETLGSGVVEQVNRLAQPYEPGDGAIVVERDISGVVPNQVITCGLNTFLVWSVDPTTKTIEVQPRWAGSPDTVMPEDSIVRMKPNVYEHRILYAINATLFEMSSPLMGMYAVATQDLDWSDPTMVYDLSECEQIEKVLRVQWGEPDDMMSEWRDLNHGKWQHRQLQPTADFPSGHQLRIFATDIDSGSTLRIVYARSLSPIDALGVDVAYSLLPETAWDIPPLGAAARLTAPAEFRRNLMTAQPDTRRSNEVQPYALLNAHKGLRSEYERRVDQEAARLIGAYPHKLR